MSNILEKVLVAVGSALILGAFAVAWQLLSTGGLISLLGGVTKEEVSQIDSVPTGAVFAFDRTEGCPEGWAPFIPAQNRVLVGASFGETYEPGMGTDEFGNALTERQYRAYGGAEAVILDEDHMPEHIHKFRYFFSNKEGSDTENDHRLAPRVRTGSTEEQRWNGEWIPSDNIPSPLLAAGDSRPHNNMPPYIALYFCKKD